MGSIIPSPETTIFKFDQHDTVISEKLQIFYEQNEFFDTVLIAGSNNSVTIQTHRIVLCAFSEYFLELFRGDQSVLNGNKVELKEIEASTLKRIIDFMYSGSIELSVETVGGILRAASFLKMKSLVTFLCNLIEENLDSSNSLSWFRLGYELSLTPLKTKALEYINTHSKEILQDKELLMLSENELKDLLFDDNPHEDIEEDVFLAMVAWLNFDKLNRKHLVLQLLSMVRYQALTPKFIIENRKSVCTTVESYELICSWLQWHLSPETRPKKKRLAIVRAFDGGQISIETFSPKNKSWLPGFEIYLAKQIMCQVAIIMIDGKLIVAGRKALSLCSENVQCFDLHTCGWIELPSMKNKRNIQQMVNSKQNLFVLGHRIHDDAISMEVYNFSTRKWKDLVPLVQPCPNVQITTHDEMLYLLDYYEGCLQSYNASSNEWTLKEFKCETLNSYSFAAIEGFLYTLGGYNEDANEWVKTVKRYNLSNDSWCEVTSLPSTFSNSKSTVFENKIVISDSCTAFEYYPDSDKWKTLSASNNSGFYYFNICHLTGNR